MRLRTLCRRLPPTAPRTYDSFMPTYLYETIPASAARQPRRFEMRQAFNESALAVDPETGDPVRRVISGGMGVMTKAEASLPEPGAGCGPETCSCGRFS